MDLTSTVKRTLPPAAIGVLRRLRGEASHKHWLRAAMYEDMDRELRALGPESLDVVEISGGQWGQLPWRSHASLSYPEFDLCRPPAELPSFDVVICDQVLEHVTDPLTAVATLRRLVRPDGHVLVATPFLVKLHYFPGDYWRFTPDGLKILLRSQDLMPVWVRSWGNKRAVVGNFSRWKMQRPWRSMRNDPLLPAVVWTLARPSSS